jgi:hypothetical protein
VGSRPANVMLIFRDIGEMRKVAESADDLDALIARETVQYRLKLVPRSFVLVAMETDRGSPNLFYDFKNMLSFLTANRIAKNAAEKADIVAKRQILVGSVNRNHDDARIDPCSR